MNCTILIRESFCAREVEVASEFYFHHFLKIKMEAFLRITSVISFINKGLIGKDGTWILRMFLRWSRSTHHLLPRSFCHNVLERHQKIVTYCMINATNWNVTLELQILYILLLKRCGIVCLFVSMSVFFYKVLGKLFHIAPKLQNIPSW